MTVSPVRDIWIHVVTWVLLTSTIACGIWQMVDGGTVISPLLISVAWAVYCNVAPSLVLWYIFLLELNIYQPFDKLSRGIPIAQKGPCTRLSFCNYEVT